MRTLTFTAEKESQTTQRPSQREREREKGANATEMPKRPPFQRMVIDPSIRHSDSVNLEKLVPTSNANFVTCTCTCTYTCICTCTCICICIYGVLYTNSNWNCLSPLVDPYPGCCPVSVYPPPPWQILLRLTQRKPPRGVVVCVWDSISAN